MRSEGYGSVRVCVCNRTGLICSLWRHKKSQLMACIDSRMLSTSVASPCQTICVLLAWRPRVNAYNIAQTSINSTAHTQCADGLHFSAFLKICRVLPLRVYTICGYTGIYKAASIYIPEWAKAFSLRCYILWVHEAF